MRPRVAIPTMRRPLAALPDLSVAIADIRPQKAHISIPTLVAQVLKEVLLERPPTPPGSSRTPRSYTPFIFEPAFSGADTDLHSTANQTLVTPVPGGLHVTCDTVLLPTSTPVRVHLYLTGKEADLPIEGQRCFVEVTTSDGVSKHSAVAKHDRQQALYLEVAEGVDKPTGGGWSTHHPSQPIRFSVDQRFALNSGSAGK
jgi:hypothetical protein